MPDMQSTQELFDTRLRTSNFAISPDTILDVLKLGMEVVELSSMRGTEKRDAVISMVRNAVVDAPMSDEVERILLEMIDDGILSHMIDVIVAASRGELHLNGIKKSGGILVSTLAPLMRRFFRLCCPCGKTEAQKLR